MHLKNKRGFTAAGFGIVVAIAILVLSAIVIFQGIGYASSKLDEDFQVKTCRFLNEIKFGLKDKSQGVLTSGESICLTVDKHTNEKSFVPKSKYKQNKEGAELEIRDMIMKCWYMWLDGSKGKMLRGYPFSESCFTCYSFRMKDTISGVTYSSISSIMEDPFYAKDTSDNCAPSGGGHWKPNKCDADERSVISKKAQLPDYKCCVKGITNGCENKGGKCSSTGKPPGDYGIYLKPEWSCPKQDQSCYVIKDAEYSYTRYIREFSPRGGEVFFKPPEGQQSEDMVFIPGEIYAVSFVSPTKQLCLKGADTSAGCYVMVGTYAIGLLGGGTLGILKIGLKGGTIIKLLSKIGLKGGALLFGAYKFGTIDNLLQEGAEVLTDDITDEVPNLMMVSTLKDAQDNLGCAVNYG